MNKEIIKTSFIKSIPIMCSYFFVSLAYGIMMEENGFAWHYLAGVIGWQGRPCR